MVPKEDRLPLAIQSMEAYEEVTDVGDEGMKRGGVEVKRRRNEKQTNPRRVPCLQLNSFGVEIIIIKQS